MKKISILKKSVYLLLIITLSGCIGRSSPSHFYMLNIENDNYTSQQCKYNSIGIMPIDIAGYLKQPQIVTQTDTTEYKISEFARWAEPIKDTLDNELNSSFQKQLNISQVYNYPWGRDFPEIILFLNIRRFHCLTNLNQCVLTASWTLSDTKLKKTISTKTKTLTSDLPDNDFTVITQQMSTLLKELSENIIQDIIQSQQ